VCIHCFLCPYHSVPPGFARGEESVSPSHSPKTLVFCLVPECDGYYCRARFRSLIEDLISSFSDQRERERERKEKESEREREREQGTREREREGELGTRQRERVNQA
jgi:hypothetical protein